MLNALARFPRLSRDARLYIWTWGAISFAYFGIYSVLFNLFLLRLGYGTEEIGLLVASGQIAWAAASIPAAIIGQRFGNRKAVIAGILVAAIATSFELLVQALPPAMQTQWLTFWNIIAWIALALLAVNGTPFLMSACTPEERSDAFSFNQAMSGLCGLTGSLVAGVLPRLFATMTGASNESAAVYTYSLWLQPIFYFVAVLLMMATKPRQATMVESESRQNSKFPLFLILFIAVIVFLQTSGEGTIRAFYNVYLDSALQLSTAVIGIIFGLAQLLPILLAIAAPLVLGRWGTGRTIAFAGMATALCLVILALFPTLLAASAGYIGALLMIALADIAINLFSQEGVKAQWRTAISSAYSIGVAIGWASTAGIGGYVIANYGYDALFLWGGLTSLVYSVLMWLYLRVAPQKQPDVAAETSPAA